MNRKNQQPWKPSKLELSIQEMARRKASRQARRVRWELLLQAREEYIEWQIFGFWVRLIVETEGAVPDWLQSILEDRCPGFLESERQFRKAHPRKRSLFASRLSAWIERNIFCDAREQGWMLAVTFYAVRDFRHHRAWTYWQYCNDQWKQSRPASYPPFEEWKQTAESWDAEPPPGASVRKAYEASKRVSPEQLSEAVTRYVDWEAFAYWTRSALEDGEEVPEVVAEELRRRFPGFLEHDEQQRPKDLPGKRQSWQRLLSWGEAHLFGEAIDEGWFEAVILYARRHPRDVRTAEYWADWSDRWDKTLEPYPSFEEWRQAADGYVVDRPDDEE